MPDIRQSTAVRDSFSRPDENPILYTAAHPWLTPFINTPPCQLEGGVIKGTAVGNQGALAAWDDDYMSDNGGKIPESWGRVQSSYTFPEGTRMGLADATGHGYIALCTGGFGFILRRYDGGGSFTSLAYADGDGAFPNSPQMQLMRLTPTHVEVWRSTVSDGSAWALIGRAADTTYRDNMMACFGSTGNEDGWTEIGFGGGRSAPPIPQIIRRRKRRGATIWHP